jgi:uncharacterized protein (DUF342 family)
MDDFQAGAMFMKLHVARDKMAAYLTIEQPDSWYVVDKEDILGLLGANHIVFGIRHDLIDAIVVNPVYNAELLVAEGKAALPGQDGRVEYMVEYDDKVAPVIMPDGRADYKNMNLVQSVAKGDVLCVVHPPTPGEIGSNIVGTPIATKAGRPAPPPRGRNMTVSPDGLTYLAAVDGQFKRRGSNIDILEEFQVQKDVDFSTGNIKFTGSVTVRGSVLSGFVIESGGDVAIYGTVEKAAITAAGNIVLHGGMVGQGGGSLRAGGDIFAKYVESASIYAGGMVTAECIMHSTTRAGAGIELIGRKGLLIGGNAKAREYVKAGTIGSTYATPTEVEVGSDPRQNDRLIQIIEEIKTTEDEIKKARQAADMLKKMKDKMKLSPEKELMLTRASEICEKKATYLAQLKAEYDGIQVGMRRNVASFVSANNTIFIGTKITIGTVSLIVKEDLKYCSLKSDGDDIRVGPY